MSKWIKNDSGGSKTWVGQQIADQAFYEIQPSEEVKFANSSKLLTDLGSGNAKMSKDGTTTISDVAEAINYLKDNVATEVFTAKEKDNIDLKLASGIAAVIAAVFLPHYHPFEISVEHPDTA